MDGKGANGTARRGRWGGWALVVGLSAGVFVLYVLGACRTIYVGDSGELVTAAATLGIPHPSGYPLYVLLGRLWIALLPLGSVAFRMSLFSAALAALSCGGLFMVARRLGLSRLAGAVGALLLATGPSFWSQANIQRVYSLNALFVVASTGAALAWFRARHDEGGGLRWLALAFFLAGLGAANHTFMGIFGGVVALFALLTQPALLRPPWRFLACGAAALPGLLTYAYLPLRSRFDPHLDWGDPETLDRFLAVVLRENFWGRAWLEGPADLVPILFDYLRSLGSETLWLGAGLAVVGAVAGVRRGWPVLLPLLTMAANVLVMASHGSRSDLFIWHRYYIPSYLMMALLAAMGVEVVRTSRPALRRLAPLALALPLGLLLLGYGRFDRSRFRIGEDFSRTLLATLPPGAHLTASDDNILFVLIYLHLVEGVRPDVDLIMQGVGGALSPLRFDPDRDPLFFTHHPNWTLEEIEVVPVGLVFRTVRSGAPWPKPHIPKMELEGEHDPRVPKDYLTQNLIGQFHYMQGVTYENRDWLRARAAFDRATAAAPRNDVLFYNLGLIYRRNGLLARSLAAFEHSHAINPRRLASSQDARAADRIAEVEAELKRLQAVEEALARQPPISNFEAGSAAYHRTLAAVLVAAGEEVAARGHELLALEEEAAAR